MPTLNPTTEVKETSRPDPAKIAFGTTFAPNFYIAEYHNGAWEPGRITSHENLSLHPGTLVLHYAQEIFEGLKAFAQTDGSVALFRPEQNARRFNSSANRMAMPLVDESKFVDAMKMVVRANADYVPLYPGSLYLRPVMIATETCIGVRSSAEFVFYTLGLPAGTYFPGLVSGAGAVDVLLSESVVRAFPGGTGNVKTAANYAVTLKITADAKAKGCSQVLFLDSTPARRVEEMGGMNVMFIEDGKLVTPPLNQTILPGVTRNSILVLAKDLGIEVREYAYTLQELLDGLESGRISEAMACGTAAVITGIRSFVREDGRKIPVAGSAPGPISSQLFERLQGIQYGKVPDAHQWMVPVEGVRVA
jgi:branched-chain amino acid aminotransferase